jgi:hypothetical protein
MTRKIIALLAALAALCGVAPALAADPAAAFGRVWERYDRPVAAGSTDRSWTWGPGPLTGVIDDNYSPAPTGRRSVQYFDKGRMELNDPNGDPNAPWYVTSGLLPIELMTGRRQTGPDASDRDRWHDSYVAAIGDPGSFPAYPDLQLLFQSPGALDPARLGRPVTDLLNRDMSIGRLDQFAGDPATVLAQGANGHGVPQAFLDFQRQRGLVYRGDRSVREQVYDPLFIFGLPITPAVWVRATIGGSERLVLFQVFERRVLTYSPANPPAFRVEMGNVGQHYLAWASNPGWGQEYGPTLEFRAASDGAAPVPGGQALFILDTEKTLIEHDGHAMGYLVAYRLFFSPDGGATRELRHSGEVGICHTASVTLLAPLDPQAGIGRIGLQTQCADNPSQSRGVGATVLSSYDGGRTFVARGRY